jgi:gamma-glutamyltranspeptidase / glutathione hydrolase
VASPHHEVTRIAIDVLERGGNAVDAAVAAAAACTVAQPFSSSLAGVGWAKVHDAATNATEVLDFHGAVPAGFDPSTLTANAAGTVDWPRLESQGRAILGMLSPAVVPGWATLLDRRGTWPLADVLAPAIELAHEGVTVSPVLADAIERSLPRLEPWPGTLLLLAPGGRALRAGERLVQSDLGHTLERVAAEGPDELVHGRTADALVAFVSAAGGCLATPDLAAHPRWAPALAGSYRDLEIRAAPGSFGDISFLQGLHLLDEFGPFGGPLDPDYLHVSVETAKLVALDRARHLGGPNPANTADLLSTAHLARLRRRIGPRAAPTRSPGRGPEDTITLAAVDGAGNAVHLMQTVGNLFGVGALAHGTGMFLNSSLYFAYAAGVRPGHPIEQNPCTMMAFDRSGALRIVVGTPGGKTRVETVRQMLVNVVDFGMDLQAAVDEGRFLTGPDGVIELEADVGPLPAAVEADLVARGHRVRLVDDRFGTGQAVAVDPVTNERLAAADWRLEATATAR